MRKNDYCSAFFTELKQTILNSLYVKITGVRWVEKWAISSLEIGTKNQSFLENLTSAA